MRVRIFNLALVAVAVLVGAGAGATTSAQAPVPLEGTVRKAPSNEPVEGATVDIFRTDVRGKYETKTDKKGNFSYPVPPQGTFTIVVSGPGLAPQYEVGARPTVNLKRFEFKMPAGPGHRPTLDDVNRAMAGGGSEDAEAAAKRAKDEEEYAKAVAEKAKFDARKIRFDSGIAAVTAKDYPTAIAELSAAVDGLETADPQYYSELASVGGSNLAEVHYRVGAELYNQKQKDQAKDHLVKAAKAIALAVKFNSANQVNYSIQGKVLLLLVDKFSMSESTDVGAAAFQKAADLETVDQKKKIGYIVSAGNVYRAGFMTDKAIETYKQALALDPTNAEAYYGIGLAAMGVSVEDPAKQKEYWQLAADYMKAFVDKLPNDPRVAADVKPLLDLLAKDYKIKPRNLK